MADDVAFKLSRMYLLQTARKAIETVPSNARRFQKTSRYATPDRKRMLITLQSDIYFAFESDSYPDH